MKGMKLLRALSALDDKDIADAWNQPVAAEQQAAADPAEGFADAPQEPGHPVLTRILEIGGLAACAALAVGMIFLIRGMNGKIETAASMPDSVLSAETTVQNADSEPDTPADGTTGTHAASTTERDASGESSEQTTTAPHGTSASQTAQTTTAPQEHGTSPAQTDQTTTDPREHGTSPAQTDQTTTDPPESRQSSQWSAETTAETEPKLEPYAVKVEELCDYEYAAFRIHDPDCPESIFREWFDSGTGGNFRQFRVAQAGDPDIPKYALPGLLKGYDVTAVFLRINELGHQMSLMSDPVLEPVHYGYNRLNLVVQDAKPVIAELSTGMHVLVLMTKPGVLPDLQNVVEERVTVSRSDTDITEQQIATQEILAMKLNHTAPDNLRTVYSAPEILSRLYYCLGPNDVTFLCQLDEKYPIEYLAGADYRSPYCIYRIDGGSLVLYFNENPYSLMNVTYAFVVYDLLKQEDFAGLKPGMTLADVERIDAGEKLIHTYNYCSVSRNMTLHMVEGGFMKITYTGGEQQYWTERKIGSDEIVIQSIGFIPNGGNVGDIDPLCDGAHFDVLPGDYDVITGA